MWPPNRQHYASCLSICPPVPYWLVTWKEKRRKIKTVTNIPRGRAQVSGVPVLNWEGPGKRASETSTNCRIFGVHDLGGISNASGSGGDCKLGLSLVRLNLLSTSEMLGNWFGRPHIMSALGADILSCCVIHLTLHLCACKCCVFRLSN